MSEETRGRPRIIETPEEFTAKAEAYFAECDEAGEPYLITGLALALGFAAVQSLHDYAADPVFSDAVNKARSRVILQREKSLILRDKPTAEIFWLKAQAGWKETDRHEHAGTEGGPVEFVVRHRVLEPDEE